MLSDTVMFWGCLFSSWRIVRVNSLGCGNYFLRKSIVVLMMVVLGLRYFSGHC